MLVRSLIGGLLIDDMVALMTYIPSCIYTYLPTYLPTYQPTHLPTYPPTYLPTYLPQVEMVMKENNYPGTRYTTNIEDFKSGKKTVLVCTNALARGLDVQVGR